MSHLVRITTTNDIHIVPIHNNYSLQLLQDLVGGYIEFVSLPDFGLEMVVNEEGKISGLPMNLVGTLYWNRQYRETLDWIMGDVVFLSSDREANGDPKPLTDEQLSTILNRVDSWFEDAEELAFDRRLDAQEYLSEKGRI